MTQSALRPASKTLSLTTPAPMTTAQPSWPCRYQDEKCTMTLQEGYDEYIAANAGDGFYDEATLGNQSGELFRNHDLVHVLFGLDTRLEHEVLADMWTFFAVDISAWRYINYLRSIPEVGDSVQQAGGVWNMVKVSVAALPKVWRAYRNSRRMTKEWPWRDHDVYRQRPLVELREEFGVTLVR